MAVSPVTAELDSARAHLEAIISNSEDAIVSKTLDSIVTTWNAAAERLFGYTATEMVGQSILRVIPPELAYQEEDILTRLKNGERIERLETVRVRKDGSRVEVSLTISPIRDASGAIVGAAKIAHDITDRRRAERAQREEAATMETLVRIGSAVSSRLDLEQIVQFVTDEATAVIGAAFGAFFYNIAREGQESYWLYTLS
ncbi:MAG: PAS domain S-box protein, partial [Pseudomonadota bacterium]|nr:PAS domain S-box protein [Pseudomonadota bacterium]